MVPEYGPRLAQPSKLDAFKSDEERLRAGVWNARVLPRELRERNYVGGYNILIDWLSTPATQRGSVVLCAPLRPPGEAGTSGLGAPGHSGDGRARTEAARFTFTLGYSRRMVAEVALAPGAGHRRCACMKPRSSRLAECRKRFRY